METNGNFHKSRPRNYIEINVFLAVGFVSEQERIIRQKKLC